MKPNLVNITWQSKMTKNKIWKPTIDYKANSHTITILVSLYRCGHCKRLKPEYAKAGELLRGEDIALAKVDCTEGGKETCTKFGVSGYPTLKIFKNGEVAQDYNGPREAGQCPYIYANFMFVCVTISFGTGVRDKSTSKSEYPYYLVYGFFFVISKLHITLSIICVYLFSCLDNA